MEHNNKEIEKHISVWMYLGAILPLSALSALFCIWLIGTEQLLDILMIVGITVAFTVSAVWWWWALYSMKRLIDQWNETGRKVEEALNEIVEVRKLVKDVIRSADDK